MKNMFFGHADEFHTDKSSDLVHFLTTEWIAIPLYALVALGIWYGLAGRLSLSSRITAELVLALLVGLTLYRWTPVLSAFAISVGFLSALVLTLTGVARKK